MAATLNSYEFGDADGFPVLIIHGWEMQAQVEQADFEPIFSAMLSLRRIYVDLPGMGKTPANGIQNLDDIYARLVEFVDARIGPSRFAVVGTSCGGYLARAITKKYGSQMDGLLLRVPVIYAADAKRDMDPIVPLIKDDAALASLSESERKAVGEAPLIQTPKFLHALGRKTETLIYPTLAAADNAVLDPIRADPSKYSLSFDVESRFDGPTLVIAARHDDNVGYRDSLKLLENYPRATYAVLDRGTHGLPVDEPEKCLFAALVRDWVLRMQER